MNRVLPKNKNRAPDFSASVQMHRAGNLSGAYQAYRRILADRPDHDGALQLLGVILYSNGANAAAAAVIGRAVRRSPETAAAHSNLALALRDDGKAEAAVLALRRAVCLQPDFSDAWSNLANALNSEGHPVEAEKACRHALQMRANQPEAWCNLANSLNDLEEPAKGLAAAQRSLILKPDSPEGLSNLGNAFSDLGRRRESEGAHRRALRLRPHFAREMSNLGASLLLQGRFPEAEAVGRAALALQPDFPEARAALAMVAAEQGRFQQMFDLSLQPLLRLAAHYGAGWAAGNQRGAAPARTLAFHILLCYWLTGRLESGLAASSQFFPLVKFARDGDRSNSLVFLRYISALLDHTVRHPALYGGMEAVPVPLFVVGESHSLAPANMRLRWLGSDRVARPVFSMGLKMYHLTDEAGDHRRAVLEQRLARLPRGADLLMTVGEIDCRPDEGLWHVHRTRNRPVGPLAEKTVAGYLEWLARISALIEPRSIVIQGIPAPSYKLAPLEDPGEIRDFLDMIRMVNRLLRDGAAARNWHFLDVHTATDAGDGSGNKVWNIDSHHLSPALYAEAPRWMRAP